MMRNILIALPLCLLAMLLNINQAYSEAQVLKLEIAHGEDIRANLQKADRKTITVILHSDKEITGRVYNVTDKLLHLTDLTNKDYYDAVIKIDSIQAIIFKARG